MDFVIAFLNTTIDRYDIFIKQLVAYKVNINLVYKLLKAFYSLK